MPSQIKDKDNISWLNTPASGEIDPPVETKEQVLPFNKLRWEDFEKLCYRLASLESNIECCRQYGVPGDEQHGIDIFARDKNFEEYQVYQCKNEKDYGPQKIKDAVKKFIDGEWYDKSTVFVLCTSESLQSRLRIDAIEEQSELLANSEKKLVLWDLPQLSTMLKSYPELVDDFFGRPWVKLFCGDNVAASLSNRLDAQELAKLRSGLYNLYSSVFDMHDPGIPLPKSLPLIQRYVIPDIEDRCAITSHSRSQEPEKAEEPPLDGIDAFKKDDGNVGTERLSHERQSPMTRHYKLRIPFQDWSAKNTKSLIFGEPGSGKTTLLRFLALDLLSDNPMLGPVAEKWGSYLPLWIPFALWTKMINDHGAGDPGLKGIIERWLTAWNKKDLVPLVENALQDKRLILLIDGLDEYSSKSSAQIALIHLEQFLNENKTVAVIATTRPNGFKKIGRRLDDWSESEIAHLSDTQQRELTSIWFTGNSKKINPSLEEDRRIADVDKQTDIFFENLDRASGLRQISNNPLLLSLLIYLQISNVKLPLSRFSAYESLVDHLISEHPLSRGVAAEVSRMPVLSSDNIKIVLSHLAFVVHSEHTEGLIEETIAERIVISFLKDDQIGLGMQHAKAVQTAKATVSMAEDDLGLLVRKSQTEISFYHRTLQEYLTSFNIFRLPIEKQFSVIGQYCDDPQWKEVILGLFQITKRPNDVEGLIKIIQSKSVSTSEKFTVETLLSEVVFGNFNCPPSLARKLSDVFFYEIENNSWLPHKEKLLSNALNGLESPIMKELVQRKIRIWFPNRLGSSLPCLYEAMAKWSLNDEVLETLFAGLMNEDERTRSAAALALGTVAKEKECVLNRLVKIIDYTDCPYLLTATVEALIVGWQGYERLPSILSRLTCSPMPSHQFLGVKGRVLLGIHTDKDLENLFVLGDINRREYLSDYIIAQILIKGWPGSLEVKSKCLISVQSYGNDGVSRLNHDIASQVLVDGYPMDDDVAKYIIGKINSDKLFFRPDSTEFFKSLSTNFKGHKQLVEALDKWIVRTTYRDVEASYLVLVGCTDTFKGKLIQDLKASFPHWPAKGLLDGWGMTDPEVSRALLSYVKSSPKNASLLGHLLPKIIENKTECRELLIETIKSPMCERYDFIIKGLVALGNTENDVEMVNIIMPILETNKTYYTGCLKAGLIRNYYRVSQVRECALEALSERDVDVLEAVAHAFGDDPEISNEIMKIATPLPASMRLIIAKYLSEAEVDSDFALSVLDLYDHDCDPGVKVQASIGYHSRLKAANVDLTCALERLNETIVCYGYDYEERRQAAFCGLVILKKLEIMTGAMEKIGSDRIVGIKSVRSFKDSVPHVQFVLENWGYLREYFGDDFWERVFRYKESTYYIWAYLARFADIYPIPRKELLGFLSENIQKTGESEILLFLSRVSPRSQLLWEYCLNSIGLSKPLDPVENSNPDVLISYRDEVTASNIVRSHFGNDEMYLNKIDVDGNKHKYDELVLLLSEGWPNSTQLDQLFDDLETSGRRCQISTIIRYYSAKADPVRMYKEIIKELRSFLRESSSVVSEAVSSPLIRRIRKDDRLLELLLLHLRSCSKPTEKICIAKLIYRARGLTPELKKIVEKELEKQLSGNGTEFGLDITSGECLSVPHAFYDIFDANY